MCRWMLSGEGDAPPASLAVFRALVERGLWEGRGVPTALFGLPQAPDEPPLDVPPRRFDEVCEVVAVDDPGTTDVDDGFSVSFSGDCVELDVHITCVADAVVPGGPTDAYARKRLLTCYLPEGTVHMLPESLATEALSLSTEPRSTVRLTVRLNEEGEVLSGAFSRSAARLARRLSFEEFETLLRGELAPLVRALEGYQRRREERGAVTVRLPQLKVSLGPRGEVSLSTMDLRDVGPWCTMQMMLLYSELAGKAIAESGLCALFRVLRGSFSRPNVPESSPLYPLKALSFIAPAELRTRPGPHEWLGVERYAQTTSPLRRYVDLVNQRVLLAALERGEAHDEEELKGVAQAVRAQERYVRRLQRERAWCWALADIARTKRPLDCYRSDETGARAFVPEILFNAKLAGGAGGSLGDHVRAHPLSVDPEGLKMTLLP